MKFDTQIELGHGGGGLKSDRLISFITSHFKLQRVENGVGLESLDDGGVFYLGNTAIVVSTDSHTVDPLFFPGGDIGTLAMCGSINDVVVLGAKPLCMTFALVLEEGFPSVHLDRILTSMNEISISHSIPIIAGDTKVLPKGQLKGVVATTTAIGVCPKNDLILDKQGQDSDKVIITGPIGDHGIALLSFRKGLSFKTDLISDVGSVVPIIDKLRKEKLLKFVHAMKDPTRGGFATAINEFAVKSQLEITLQSKKIPIRSEVCSASEMLGLDPLEIACEGRIVMLVDKDHVKEILSCVQSVQIGKEAVIVGSCKKNTSPRVILETEIGGKRILRKPIGELIPRVC